MLFWARGARYGFGPRVGCLRRSARAAVLACCSDGSVQGSGGWDSGWRMELGASGCSIILFETWLGVVLSCSSVESSILALATDDARGRRWMLRSSTSSNARLAASLFGHVRGVRGSAEILGLGVAGRPGELERRVISRLLLAGLGSCTWLMDCFGLTGAFIRAIVQGLDTSIARRPCSSSSSITGVRWCCRNSRSSSSMPYILDLHFGCP